MTMRLYQIGKTAVESNSQLELGLRSMTEYASMPKTDSTISKECSGFRLAQLRFLIDDYCLNVSQRIKFIFDFTQRS